MPIGFALSSLERAGLWCMHFVHCTLIISMPAHTAKELAYISTIIKVSASTVDWSKELGVADGEIAIQEVQCMQIGDNLFIAANPLEDALVKNYLERFHVSNYTELQSCLRYSHNLLSMEHPKRKKKTNLRQHVVGKGYDAKYSTQDKAVIDTFVAKKPTFLTAFSDDDLDTIERLVTKTTSTPGDQRLSWFLRKFIKESTAQGAVKATGSPTAFLTSYSSATTVNILPSATDIHAEIRLLTLLGEAVIANAEAFRDKTIHIGGAKKACANCALWIKYFRQWLLGTFNVTLAFPADDGGDTRSVGSGAGKRPLSTKFDSYEGYIKTL